MSLSVLGAGAFGTALATSFARQSDVTLWGRSVSPSTHDADLRVTHDLESACTATVLCLAIPMQSLRSFLKDHAPLFKGKTLVACCKGIDIETGLGPVATILAEVESPTGAILTGPSFASDILLGLPTALTLACANEDRNRDLQIRLSAPHLRIYRTTDTIGAEVGGALKNVIAIASGAAIGANLGESARASIITRGFAEMQRFALFNGARAETLSGLSGFGDLTLTCTSEQSRNYRLGLSLGYGQTFDPSITVEGAATAHAVHRAAQRSGIEMPITQAVAEVLSGTLDVRRAIETLLSRPARKE